MGVSLAFDGQNGAAIQALPGGEAACNVRVRNTGMVVDQVLLDVLGDTKGWATVEPPQLNLLPGTEGAVRVVFRPPRASTPPAGQYPFALRAMSHEDPEGSVIEEGAVALGSFTDISATLVPKTSHGRRSGHHKLIVENRGNGSAELSVAASDVDDAIEFHFKPEVFIAEPGTATFIRLRAAPRKRFLKGASKSLPFQAFVVQGEGEPIKTDGAMLQQQIMPEWLLPVLAIACVAAAALVALWFLVLKPEVHAAATQAVGQQMSNMTASAKKANSAAAAADQAAKNANSAAAAGKSASGSSGSSASTPTGSAADLLSSAAPVSALLQSDVAPGKTSTYTYKLTGAELLTVSDLVLENPAGNNGIMTIKSGSSPLFEFALADFRDLDYHFVQPLEFSASHPLELMVACQNTGSTHCTAALSFSGAKGMPPPTPTPTPSSPSPSATPSSTSTSVIPPATPSASPS
jgi:hypothetical protein